MKNIMRFFTFLLIGIFFISCGKEEKTSTTNNVLSLVLFGEYYKDENNVKKLVEAYKKEFPDKELKVEVLPATEYDNTMKIRNSANKLPDLFVTRVITMNDFKNVLKPLTDSKAAKLNRFANEYAIDGNIYGVPFYGFNEFVYYRKSVFNELGLNVPTTWGEFIELQEKIKQSGKYIPMALGGKDSWSTYPYNEFMPFLEKDGKDIWTKMGNDDSPFSQGKPFYEAYKKIDQYYKGKYSGDSLGYGFTQARDMLISKKAAMLTAGQWFYSDYLKEFGNNGEEDLGVFILPTRNNKSETSKYLVTAELFLGISKDSKNSEEAQKFLDWLFSSEYYKKTIEEMNVLSAVSDIKGESIFSKAISEIDNPEIILQKGGDTNFKKIANFISFDVKRMGQEMMQGVNFNEYMEEYNKKWKEAKDNQK